MTSKWIQSAPGTLVLEGTIMSVVYRKSPSGDFHVYQGDRLRQTNATLEYSKQVAERFYGELVEIGAQDGVDAGS